MKKRRLIAVFLACFILLSNVSIIVFAANKPTLTVDTVEASPGDTVEINVCVSNNTGIAGALLEISYDSNLTLLGAENGDAFNSLTFTKPGKLANPSKFLWDSECEISNKDGTILTLLFIVSDSVEEGTLLDIDISCKSGDFYNSDMETIEVDTVNGGVNIAKFTGNKVSFFDKIISFIKKTIAIIIYFFKTILGGK